MRREGYDGSYGPLPYCDFPKIILANDNDVPGQGSQCFHFIYFDWVKMHPVINWFIATFKSYLKYHYTREAKEKTCRMRIFKQGYDNNNNNNGNDNKNDVVIPCCPRHIVQNEMLVSYWWCHAPAKEAGLIRTFLKQTFALKFHFHLYS